MRKLILLAGLITASANAETWYYTVTDVNTATILEWHSDNPMVVPTIAFPDPDNGPHPPSSTYIAAPDMERCGGGVYTCVLPQDGVYFWRWERPDLGLSLQIWDETTFQGEYERGGTTTYFGDIDLAAVGVYSSHATLTTLSVSNTGYFVSIPDPIGNATAPEPVSASLLGIGLAGLGLMRFRGKR